MVLSDLVNNLILIIYVMFMDIDEFWVFIDFIFIIGDFVENIGIENVICFNWLNDLLVKEVFGIIFSVLVGLILGVVKSLFLLFRKIRVIRLYKLLLIFNNYISVDGKEFKEFKNEDEYVVIGCYLGVFIYYWFYRLEIEYVFLLFRGNLEGSVLFYKINCNGLLDSEIIELSYIFVEERYVVYILFFEVFI